MMIMTHLKPQKILSIVTMHHGSAHTSIVDRSQCLHVDTACSMRNGSSGRKRRLIDRRTNGRITRMPTDLLRQKAVPAEALDITPYDDIACNEDTRPRVLSAAVRGTINSPDFDLANNQTYPPNSLCEWQITMDADYVFEFQFLNFSLEDCNQCKCDRVEVYDESPDEANLIGSYCGQQIPQMIVRGPGDTLFIRFVSDDTHEYTGFVARYGQPAISDAGCDPATRPQLLTSNNGTIMSPEFPLAYPHNSNCDWLLEADEGETWTLDVLRFELECGCYDFLRVYDGADDNAPRLGEWRCFPNVLPPRLTSSGRHLYITFDTDPSVAYSGFFSVFHKNEPASWY